MPAKPSRPATHEQLLEAAAKSGDHHARTMGASILKNEKYRSPEGLRDWALNKEWHLAHEHTSAVNETHFALEARHLSWPDGVSWKDSGLRESFAEAFIARCQQLLVKGLSSATPKGLLRAAKSMGSAAGKSAVLDLDPDRDLDQQLADMAADAWAHDGLPGLEDSVTDRQFEHINDGAVSDAYETAFIENVRKRLEKKTTPKRRAPARKTK